MTRVFYCSTLFGAMTVAAAIDDGRFGAHDERRLLLVSNNTPTPEAYASAIDQPGFSAIRDRFDDIVSWNDVIAPLHPAAWSPRLIEIPMMARLVSDQLGLQDGVEELVLESIAVAPARSIAGLIRDCPITVYSDGLMSYGPTRDPLPPETAGRIRRLLHLDLAPGMRPLLLSEYDVPSEALPGAAFRAVADSITALTTVGPRTGRRAVILGQYLSALDLLTAREEADLHADMLDAVLAGGYDDVVFKPHPSAGRAHARELTAVAEQRGVQLTIADEADPAEVCFASLEPDLVVGCFSTALATASLMYDIPVAAMGTELVLERLAPFENSNRIPATIIDATVPRLHADGTAVEPPPTRLQPLIEAVGFCMQAEAYPHLRQAAVDYLAAHGRQRYFKKRRLESLELIDRPAPKKPAAAPTPAATSAPSVVALAGSLRSAAAERIKRRRG